MKPRIVDFEEGGVVLRAPRREPYVVRYEEILTAERPRHPGRGLLLHTRRRMEPIRALCRRRDQLSVESALRFVGVRVVDCNGAIIAPTLLDFEEELANEPMAVRQSSDDA